MLERGYIPEILKKIIIAYTKSNVIIFCLQSNYLLIAKMDDHSPKTSKATIIDINDVGVKSEISHKLALVAANSMKLPPKIFNSIGKYNKYNKNDYHALFNISGQSNTMYLVHRNEIKQQQSTAFKWNLPSLQHGIDATVYDDEYGLLSFIGGYENSNDSLCSLSFTSNEYQQQNNWKWQKFGGTAPNSKRIESSCVIMKTDDNKKKLFVCGGWNGRESADIFDFAENKWSSIEGDSDAADSGICYDQSKQRIFVGGGRAIYKNESRCRMVQLYDLSQNEWYNLPKTWNNYWCEPIMWVSENDHNLLFIGSEMGNCLEYIDLRENERKWKVIRCEQIGQSLADFFGLETFKNRHSLFNFETIDADLCLTKY